MEKKTKKILVGTGVFAASVVAVKSVSNLVTKYLMKMAIDREPPVSATQSNKMKERIMADETICEFTNAIDTAKEKLESSDFETVDIVADDGIMLLGHWRQAESPKRTIIAMHGWRSSWSSDFGIISDFWHENDCNVLYVEQRGQNNSGGDYMGFGLLERFDCLNWIRWVNERCGLELPIYLGGVSMGASTVLMATGLDLPENVKGVVADCGFTSPYAIWKHVVEDNLRLPYGLYATAVEDICKKAIQVSPKDYSTVDAMKVCKVPVLFIHGTDDGFVPVEMSYENYKACIAPKRIMVVPGANHGMSYFIDKEKYEKEIKEFWREYDV